MVLNTTLLLLNSPFHMKRRLFLVRNLSFYVGLLTDVSRRDLAFLFTLRGMSGDLWFGAF